MAESVVTEAEARYLEEIADDCERCLGPETMLLGIEWTLGDAGPVLVLQYRLGEHERESRGTGATILAAHEDLRAQILVDRLRYGLADLVEPR
jgi:hypothetical protein